VNRASNLLEFVVKLQDGFNQLHGVL
jgi:hypothetical protein